MKKQLNQHNYTNKNESIKGTPHLVFQNYTKNTHVPI